MTPLTPEELARDLAIRDLADPDAGPHAIQLITDRAVRALESRWHCEVRRCSGPRIVPVADNYDRLGYRTDAITRDARYTRYLDEGSMLRSHATAMIPPALRELAAGPAATPDVLLACPGMVYRRDAIDRLRTGTPHQLDLWRITRAPMTRAQMTPRDLREMIQTVLDAVLPGAEYRLEARRHPYTTDGVQVDVRSGADWVEVGEGGLAAAAVLRDAGPEDVSGLALGLGLDRLLMLAKAVPDIRLLRSADPRVAAQLLDLAPYRAVSDLPAISRDLSVAVAADDVAEDLGDRVRGALGEDASRVEEVRILSRTPAARLPAAARARLGATPDQHNLLVRVVLRDLARTLTDPEANRLRDRIYAAIHQGSARQWAAI
jgi:phenylalanyl-tRNA synthetase alpha chain